MKEAPGIDSLHEKEKLFNKLVIEWNQKINLVSRKKTDVFDLIDESKYFFDFIDFSKNPKILDLGTGGGFPGIVIKLYHPEIKLTLVDSIQKKMKAAGDIISRMDINDVDVICSRAEELAKNPLYLHAFDYVTARSVALLNELTRWSRDLLKPGGKLVTLKGGEIGDELKRTKTKKYVKKLGIFPIGLDSQEKKIIIAEF
jgi:16S rRNA (guanine527-N7)-methyltransferase